MRRLTWNTMSARLLRRLIPIIVFGVLLEAVLDEIFSHETLINRSLFSSVLTLAFLIGGTLVVVKVTRNVFRDIDQTEIERNRAEKALRESEEKLRLMFETSPIGMAMCEMNGNLIQMNQAYLKIIGYTHEEAVKLSYWDVTPKEYDEGEKKQLRSMAETGKYGPYEKEYIRKTGERIPILLNGMVVTGADGVKRIWSLVEDITERKNAEQRLAKEKIFIDSAINSLPGIFYLFDTAGRFLRWNRNLEEISGYSAAEIAKMIPQDLFAGQEKDLITRKIQEAFSKGQAAVEAHLVSKSGKKISYLFTGLKFVSDNQNYLTGMGVDLTERKNAEEVSAEQHRLLRTLIDNIPDSIYVKDLEGRKILTNRSDLDFIGAKNEADVLGKTDADVYPKHLSDLYDRVDQHVLREGIPVVNLEESVESASGVKRWLLTSKIPLKDGEGKVTGLVGIGRDITERKLLEVKLLTMAHYDTLTEIPNRSLFFENAALGLAHAKRTGMQCAVLFIDLDNFKSVNDILGHFIGDELIKDTAAKLIPCIRETDVIARLGGDEFVILLNDLKDTQGIQQTAERIREEFNVPRMIAGNNLFITVSIGISIYPNDGDTVEELLKKADTAMYAAKVSGRNACCFFDHVMNENAITKMQIERGLRDALEKKELTLFYQPIVSVSDGKVRGFEALLRWFRAKNVLVLPNDFIPIAEETGLIVPIGEWVLFEACRFNKKLIDHGYGNMVVSVNMSVAQLRRKNIVDIIKVALDQTGLSPKYLEIEVTESMFIQSFEAAIEILNDIRALGVQVSLDDFGTGYSSLVHLQSLPIANVKIDRLFIKQISEDSDEKAMIPAIIDLAHKLKLNVVAEGVETDIQLKRLFENHCDYYQGYLLSKPMPEDQVTSFLDRMRTSGCL